MKLTKLANTLKLQVPDLIEAARKAGVDQPKADSEITEQQEAAIKAVLSGAVPQSQQQPGQASQGFLVELVEQVAQERLAMARLKPQINQMFDSAIAQYESTGGTLPPNPTLHKWVPALAIAESGDRFSGYGSLDALPVLDLDVWMNDPSPLGALGPAPELLLQPAKEGQA